MCFSKTIHGNPMIAVNALWYIEILINISIVYKRYKRYAICKCLRPNKVEYFSSTIWFHHKYFISNLSFYVIYKYLDKYQFQCMWTGEKKLQKQYLEKKQSEKPFRTLLSLVKYHDCTNSSASSSHACITSRLSDPNQCSYRRLLRLSRGIPFTKNPFAMRLSSRDHQKR